MVPWRWLRLCPYASVGDKRGMQLVSSVLGTESLRGILKHHKVPGPINRSLHLPSVWPPGSVSEPACPPVTKICLCCSRPSCGSCWPLAEPGQAGPHPWPFHPSSASWGHCGRLHPHEAPPTSLSHPTGTPKHSLLQEVFLDPRVWPMPLGSLYFCALQNYTEHPAFLVQCLDMVCSGSRQVSLICSCPSVPTTGLSQ